MNQRELGRALGSSLRSAQRWAVGQATPGEHQLLKLARLLYPVDRALAAEVAAWLHDTLEGLGIEAPPPPPAPPAPPPPAPPPAAPVRAPPPVTLVVESVVCAVAEVLETTPAKARDAVRAGFARARALGLSVEAVDGALAPAAPSGGDLARAMTSRGGAKGA